MKIKGVLSIALFFVFSFKSFSQVSNDVGFKTIWLKDTTRKYEYLVDSTKILKFSNRPILMNIWFPTNDKREQLVYKDYLDIINNSNPKLREFTEYVYDYTIDIIISEIFNTPHKQLDDKQKGAFDAFLDSKRSVTKNAEYAEGKFPLIIYHPGAGSSFDDNVYMLEFLASHGFVVISSMFQKGDGTTLNIDYSFDSFKDIDFLIDYTVNLNIVNPDNIVLLGHSAGAQTILKYTAHSDRRIKALVLLDTTQDIHSLEMVELFPFISEVLPLKKNFKDLEILSFAGSSAIFQLQEELSPKRNYFVTTNDIKHNEYISQGIIASQLIEGVGSEYYKYVQNNYSSINNTIVEFLKNNTLEKIKSPSMKIESYYEKVKLNKVPSPHQLFNIYKNNSLGETLEILNKMKHLKDTNSIYTSDFGFALVYDLLAKKKIKAAKEIFNFYKSIDKGDGIVKKFETWCWIGKMKKEDTFVRKCENYIALIEK